MATSVDVPHCTRTSFLMSNYHRWTGHVSLVLLSNQVDDAFLIALSLLRFLHVDLYENTWETETLLSLTFNTLADFYFYKINRLLIYFCSRYLIINYSTSKPLQHRLLWFLLQLCPSLELLLFFLIQGLSASVWSAIIPIEFWKPSSITVVPAYISGL